MLSRLSRQRGWILLLGFLLTTVTANLAAWQWRRAQEKAALQAQYLDLQQRPALTAWPPAIASLPEATPMRLTGHWLSDKTIYLDNRPRPAGVLTVADNPPATLNYAAVGYYVLTPLRLAGSKQTVLVLRGWLPRAQDARTTLPAIAPDDTEATVTVVGHITRYSHQLLNLAPGAAVAGEQHGKLWQNLDWAAYQRWSGLQLPPVLLRQIQATQTEGQIWRDNLSRNWSPPNFGIEKHYGYCAQWAALSLASLVFALVLWRRAATEATPSGSETE
ncbi:SURF1 family protein [Parvibium lacunae]|nr:SURF1 family protein [Parvibium lacunae]